MLSFSVRVQDEVCRLSSRQKKLEGHLWRHQNLQTSLGFDFKTMPMLKLYFVA